MPLNLISEGLNTPQSCKWVEKQQWCLWCGWQNPAGESRVFQAPGVPRHHYHIHEKNRRWRGGDHEGVAAQSAKGGYGRHLGKHQQKLPGVLSSLSSTLWRSECSRDPRKYMWWTYPHPGEKKSDFFCIWVNVQFLLSFLTQPEGKNLTLFKREADLGFWAYSWAKHCQVVLCRGK